MSHFSCVFSLLGLLASFAAVAADPVTDAMNQAYAPYRVVLFRTNSQAQAESEQTIRQARKAWASVIERYSAHPPFPYAGDASFGTSLSAVAQVYDKAAEEIDLKKLSQAHETLEQARDLMADLRRRNGVIVFSDHMNAYHSEMEYLLEHGKMLLSSQRDLLQLTERVGVLNYLAGKLRSEADQKLLENPEFVSGLKALENSVAELRKAALGQDAEALRAALGQLKKPYSLLFLKFG